MKVLFVIDSLGSGGAQQQIVNIAAGFKERGHSVHLFRYSKGGLLEAKAVASGIFITTAQKTRRFSVRPALALRTLVKQFRPDAMVAFLPTPSLYALLASSCIRPRVPVIVSERSNWSAVNASVVHRLVLQAYRRAERIVANSFHLGEAIARKCHWLAPRLVVIWNGIDLLRFCPRGRRNGEPPLRILAIGSVSEGKNGLCLVEALRRLCEAGISARVTWLGEQVLHLPGRAAYLRRMLDAIDAAGVKDVWTWRPPRGDVEGAYAENDVLVHPSIEEGLPNVVGEALASALPVMVSDTLDHPKLVQQWRSGILFDPGSPQNLAECLQRFARLSPAERARIGALGRQFAEERLSMERCVEDFEHLVAEVAGYAHGEEPEGPRSG